MSNHCALLHFSLSICVSMSFGNERVFGINAHFFVIAAHNLVAQDLPEPPRGINFVCCVGSSKKTSISAIISIHLSS